MRYDMGKKYIIEGGYPTKGKIKASGNKNAALPLIAASLLTDEEVVLHNIPNIEDIKIMFSIAKQLGVQVTKKTSHSYSIKGTINNTIIDSDLGCKIRTSILFAGPLLARLGEVQFPPPGGDVIGRRRLDTHFLALSDLGCKIEINGYFKITVSKLTGTHLFLDEASVTGTENAIMVSVLAEGNTLISNAASEPHIQDLCNFLNKMGAHIEGIGSNQLKIIGVKKLYGCEFKIGSDYMEVGSFIGLAAVTKGELEIIDAQPENMMMTSLAFKKMGIKWETDGNSIFVPSKQELIVNQDIGNMIPKIDDAPWPGFPPDLISIAIVCATQVSKTILICEKMFESRLFFVDKLVAMGAKIILCDPHRVVITGPSSLKALDLSSPDIRAGMAMILAASCANGISSIHNVVQIERGYENIVERLKSIGIKIVEKK
jgi:UDP-N-acetylglucosamine 1-carboxyvinyltransferase